MIRSGGGRTNSNKDGRCNAKLLFTAFCLDVHHHDGDDDDDDDDDDNDEDDANNDENDTTSMDVAMKNFCSQIFVWTYTTTLREDIKTKKTFKFGKICLVLCLITLEKLGTLFLD